MVFDDDTAVPARDGGGGEYADDETSDLFRGGGALDEHPGVGPKSARRPSGPPGPTGASGDRVRGAGGPRRRGGRRPISPSRNPAGLGN